MMSYVDPDGIPPASGAARVGAELRAARQRLGWELSAVAAGLRIRQPYLEAIEQGHLSELPGNAYAMGFVRTYANSLGLDPDEVTRRFREEAQEVTQKTRLSFPAPVPQRGVPAGAVILVGVVILAGAYVGWFRYSGHDETRVTQTASAIPEKFADKVPQQQNQSPQVSSLLASGPPLTAPSGAPAPAASAPATPEPIRVPVNVAPPAPAPVAAPLPSSGVVLRAKIGQYVKVQDPMGTVLLDHPLKTGESWPVPLTKGLRVTTPNAGGLEVLVNGTPIPPFGPVGSMRQSVPLDPVLARAAKANSTGTRPAR
ncbi:helix-turn-helix domain-containing protein [Acidisphaera sp. L21]|uniref:helix-turn-helix domain-containing protein n=1 Tax=Acidisphaera sp. L21 TaxID=1641851 RepID=UPI00131D60EE|nr:helix-turn-helix domain-containing protein [Acidisphaera sp. L21]